ncbi:hypothetical protein P608_10285 [Comamonas thiooxydans]|uniref:Uncharacterized protein n=1 Tax=Comamonas thiooxydans TaxID=363952 RepID=A0A0E3C224_9BURK|nr:hypothetical protein P608_10285 [Comamonas thiooxydans]KGH13792.1 hypothetical protein P607_23950 [Comamonas thiooxydans]
MHDDDRNDIAAAKNEGRMALHDGIPHIYVEEGIQAIR